MLTDNGFWTKYAAEHNFFAEKLAQGGKML